MPTSTTATRLNQIVALEKGVKAAAKAVITGTYHLFQKGPLLEGISRTYVPKDEDGDQLPAESTSVQVRAADILSGEVRTAWVRLLDVVAAKDKTNTLANADIKIGDTVIAEAVPVTHLLWLQHELTELHALILKLPVLDAAFDWVPSSTGDWATPPTQSVKTKKIPKAFVKAPATDKHPAQVDVFNEDVIVGTWTTIKYSGAVPAAVQRQLLARVTALQDAVKIAKETANMTEVTDMPIGQAIFDYLLG